MAVIRDLEVSEQLHAAALLGEPVIGRKRNSEVVAHATDIDDGVVRISFNEESADKSNHGWQRGKGGAVWLNLG
jgi:hypothetical protein